MEPRGPLMIEHRLIMRMLAVIEKEADKIDKDNVINRPCIDIAVDFIKTYADRTHHGKEEDILFRKLEKKELSKVDIGIMNELVQEHAFGRITTADLSKFTDAYQNGDAEAVQLISVALRKFIDFFPKHIEKEEKIFFPLAMEYLSEVEQQAMLDEFWEFDRKLIHEKYSSVVDSLENRMDNMDAVY